MKKSMPEKAKAMGKRVMAGAKKGMTQARKKGETEKA
jgi:hypothetical protein